MTSHAVSFSAFAISQEIYQKQTVKKAFFSDPSTYPLIAIMSFALILVTGMGTHALLYYKNLRIKPEHKHDVLKTWETEPRGTLTEKITRNPIAFHSKGFKNLRHEGLGVDHEQWKKDKEHSK